MVLTLPMFSALRERFPDAHLTLITRSLVEPLVHVLDVIDDVVFVDTASTSLYRILRDRKIDTAFFPRPQLKEVWAAMRAGVHNRIGSAFRWYSVLFTTRIRTHRSDARHHEAEYNVQMISSAFGGATPEVRLVSPRHTDATHASASPWIVIHPGSGGSSRDWPATRFGQLAHALHAELGAHVIITGIASEKALCNEVHAQCPAAENLCGQLELEDLIDLLASTDVICANSTGVIHIAASLGIGVVGFYPSTPSMSARRWGPYTKKSVILESGVGDNMNAISVESAVAAVRSLL